VGAEDFDPTEKRESNNNFDSQSYQPFFFVKHRFFSFFEFKLGHFKEQTMFYYASNTQAYQQK
jgi:hypothetical protein